MKALKFLGCILGLLCFQPSVAQDLTQIDQDINQIHQKTIDNPNNTRIILQNRAQLKFYKNLSLKCIAKQKSILAKLEKYRNFLKPSGQIPYLLQEKNKLMQNINMNEDKLQLCVYMHTKISSYLDEIDILNKKIYQRSLFQLDDNIWENFRKINLIKWQFIPFKDNLNFFIENTNTIHSIRNVVLVFFLLILMKIFDDYKVFNIKSTRQLHIGRFISVALIFFVVSPAAYLMIQTKMMLYEEVFVQLFTRPLTNLLNIFFISYLFFYMNTISKKEICLAFISLILKLLLVRYSLDMTYLMIHDGTLEQILAYKYLILIFLMAQIFLILYWVFFKIIRLNQLPSYVTKIFIIFEFILFIFGIIGYVNLVININIGLIIFTVLLLWLFVLTKLKNMFFSALDNNNKFLIKFYHITGFDLREGGLNLKIVIYYLYILSIFVILLTISSLSMPSIWLIPADFVQNLYDFIFSINSFHQFSFRISDYLYAILAFFLLNSINKILSNFMARKWFTDPVSIQKTGDFFYTIGFVVVMMISLVIANFQFKNFALILGGLSFGVGLGLKNILAGFVSSIFLFVNRPYEVGDFVAIGETKGYVKKISVMETIIETIDENVLILPNQMVINSVIYNFNYDKKGSQKIHLKYSLEHMSEDDEQKIQKFVMEILNSQSHHIDKKDPPKVIFSPLAQSLEGYYFEVIFGVISIKKTSEVSNLVNRLILDKLQALNLNIKYESSTHPLQS